ncbi:MAG: hypothetical protein WAO02_14145, partial [Verrucomicrobiia bacterium]
AKKPEVRDWILKDWISPEERERRIREIYGLTPKEPSQAADDSDAETAAVASGPTNGQESPPIQSDQTESNQIKPNENTTT